MMGAPTAFRRLWRAGGVEGRRMDGVTTAFFPDFDAEALADLVENASDLIQSVDLDGRFLYVNRRWRERLGYTTEEIARLRLFDVIRPDHHPQCRRLFEALCGGTDLGPVETVFLARNGEEVELEGQVTLRCDPQGRPRSTRGVFRDVGEQRAARRRVDELLAKTSAIIAHAPVGISLYRPDGQCVEANEALARIVGGPVEQVRSFNFRRLESWRRHGLLECAEACLASGEPRTLETTGSTTFGTPVTLLFRFVPVTLGGEPHLLVLTEDKTEERRREKALVAHQQRLLRLGEVARQIASQTDLDRMLRTAVERACELTRADTGAIVRLDPQSARPLGLHVGAGRIEALPSGTELRLHGLLGRVARGETIRTARADAEPSFAGWPEWHPPVGPMLGLPLSDRDRIVAMLLLGRTPGAEPFDDGDHQIAEMIGNLIVVAIRVSRQFTDLQRLNA